MTVSETATFGDLLRHYRLAAGLTQEALAERAALSATAIAALERGRRGVPRPQTMSLLVEALSLVSPDRERFLGAAFAARAPARESGAPAPRAAPARLPTPPAMLIEREREEAAVAHLLGGGARLVTLTGPGGVGKTRLAVQVASGLQTSYADGAAFVDLSALRDAALVPSTVAHALGLQERGPRNGRALLLEQLSGKHRLLPPIALLSRLDRRLAVLVGGPRDLPARQQTLRDTIAWSYDLVDEDERQLFRALAVFEGGFTLEAVEAVGSEGDGKDALQGVGQLEEKSLLQRVSGGSEEARYGMLQTIRDFALERLEAHGESPHVRARHADFFLRLAEEADPHLRSRDRNVWMQRLNRESDNLRAALAWAETETSGRQIGLRLAVALTWFWRFREWLAEGRSWLEAMLARTDGTEGGLVRAKALYGAGMLAWYQGDPDAAAACTEEALAILRLRDERADKDWRATTLRLLGLVRMGQGDPAAARPLLEESRMLFHEMGDVWGEAMALYRLGLAAGERGDAAARTYYEGSLALFERVQDSLGISVVLNALAVTAAAEGDQTTALAVIARGLPLARASAERWDLARLLLNAGTLWLRQGDDQQAQDLFAESLSLWRDFGHLPGVALSLAGLADVAAARGEPERAGRLYAVAHKTLPPHAPVLLSAGTDLDARIAEARQLLDPAAFEDGWRAGQDLSLEEAIDEAIANTSPSQHP
ncbi:MAG: tetratricopeptide repeat protein [Chloroflexi bacterium]|nr:tetratricopeptide repeat protein [Chloroflexota bacterium]